MKHFDVHNAASENDDSIQIVDLDPEGSRQRRRTRTILTTLYQGVTKPWISYTLIGAILLILFSAIFLEYHWPFSSASSLSVRAPTVPLSLPAPAQLQQRPLHFPLVTPGTACPTSPEKHVNANIGIAQGDGPVYATIGTDTITSPAIFHYTDAQHSGPGGIGPPGWGGGKVLWFVNPSYQGLILIRGRQVDGSHSISFSDNDAEQHFSQQLIFDTTQAGPWESFGGYTLLQAPGCYAYQVDGANFSYLIIFQAVVQN